MTKFTEPTDEERLRMGLGPKPVPKTEDEVREASGMSRAEWLVWSEAKNDVDANEMLDMLAQIRDEKAKAELKERMEAFQAEDE